MIDLEVIVELPTYLAIDALAVLEGSRPGASVQLGRTYLSGQRTALEGMADRPAIRRRRRSVRETEQFLDEITVDVEDVSVDALGTASRRLGRLYRQLPEVTYLREAYPGRCVVVPEWLRGRGELKYGPRVYFLPAADSSDGAGPSAGDGPGPTSVPDPDAILRANVEDVVDGDARDFDRLVGRRHGYPACCIAAYVEADRTRERSPEGASVEPLADRVEEDALEPGRRRNGSIDEVLDAPFELPDVYGFYSREFFPEPGCPEARRRGLSLFDDLEERLPRALVRDHYALNYAWSYLVAGAVGDASAGPPTPGCLGREDLLFHRPLAVTIAASRYGNSD